MKKILGWFGEKLVRFLQKFAKVGVFLIKNGVIFGTKVQKLGIQKIWSQNVEINAKGAEVAGGAKKKFATKSPRHKEEIIATEKEEKEEYLTTDFTGYADCV